MPEELEKDELDEVSRSSRRESRVHVILVVRGGLACDPNETAVSEVMQTIQPMTSSNVSFGAKMDHAMRCLLSIPVKIEDTVTTQN